MKKFKLVIAEDEPPILRNIRHKVENSGTGFEVSGTASDGREALLLIESIKPDVVLVDINMPFIDGISLIREVKEKYPEIIFVIISGYQEFDYARKAMKLGVEDYLVKPVTIETIQSILASVENQLKSRLIKSEREFLSGIVRNENIDVSKNMHDAAIFYNLALFCFGPYSSSPINLMFSENVGISNEAIEDFFSKRLKAGERCWVVNGRYTNEKIAIINHNGSSENEIIQTVKELMSQNTDIQAPLTAAVSKTIKFGEINASIQEARKIIQNGLVIGISQVLTNRNIISPLPSGFIINLDTEKLISSLFLQGNRKLLKNELHKLFLLWENQNCPQSTLDKLLKHMLSLLQRQVIGSSLKGTLNADLYINEILSTSLSFNDVFQGFWYIVENLLQNQKQTDKDGDISSQLIDQAEAYICKNITEALNLQTLAAMVNLAPQYFCMLFKKYKGASPIEYLINLRIAKAKELLKLYSQIPVKDIAEMVGYSDQHYFSKIFKASTGLSPKEYRNSTAI